MRTAGVILIAIAVVLYAGVDPRTGPLIDAAAQKAHEARAAIENWISPPPPTPTLKVGFMCSGPPPRQTVAYVIDGSGVMAPRWDFVMREMRKMAGGFCDHQDVAVIIARARGPEELLGPGPHAMTAEGRRALGDALALCRAEPAGPVDPTDAICLALSHAPDQLFLLSPGLDRLDAPAIADDVAAMNECAGATIYTLQLMSTGRDRTLIQLAGDHDGRYRQILSADFGLTE